MMDNKDFPIEFHAFEDRFEQLAIAIVVTLLATSILGFVFFLIDLA